MRDVSGWVAIVSGGASGIGHAMARAFLGAGMKVTIADIDASRLAPAARELDPKGTRVHAAPLDVTDRDAWERVADETERRFGAINIVCNNAGIQAIGWSVEELPPALWDRQIGINLTGVFNGAHCVIPRIRKHGKGGHVVNTASISGLRARPRHPGYIAAKHAVVGLSEGLRAELEPYSIGVSVLCPGAIATRLGESSKAIHDALGSGAPPHPEVIGPQTAGAMSLERYGERVLRAVRENEFFVLSHPEYRDLVTRRHADLMAAFDRAEAIAREIGYTPAKPI